MKRTLIVGGSSGLGLAMAKEFADLGDKVYVTGRHKPEVDFVEFKRLDLSVDNLPVRVGALVSELPPIERFVYAAGFYKQAPITELSDKQIEDKLNIGARGLIYTLREVLKNQKTLNELIVITSMSQWNPSQEEPVYNFIKAGAGNFSKGLAKDGQVKKVLVVAPGFMKEGGWTGMQKDEVDTSLDKGWVAKQVLAELDGGYSYKAIKIMQKPARVEEAELV